MLRMLAVVAAVLVSHAVLADGPENRVREALAELAPNTPVSRVEQTPVEGLYAAVVGTEVYYVTADGQYLLQGELVDVAARRSLTEATRRELRLARLDELGEERMLIYAPDGEVRHEVTVFTDIDCPYCRKLHRHMDEYLARGIRVRYLLMPRAGRDSRSYDKAVWAWCADDPRAALTRAKAGEALDARTCDNPVDTHLEVAREFGVRGTPSLVTDDGRMVSGYKNPDQMERLLESDDAG